MTRWLARRSNRSDMSHLLGMNPVLQSRPLGSTWHAYHTARGVMGRLEVCRDPPGNNHWVGLRFRLRQ